MRRRGLPLCPGACLLCRGRSPASQYAGFQIRELCSKGSPIQRAWHDYPTVSCQLGNYITCFPPMLGNLGQHFSSSKEAVCRLSQLKRPTGRHSTSNSASQQKFCRRLLELCRAPWPYHQRAPDNSVKHLCIFVEQLQQMCNGQRMHSLAGRLNAPYLPD